MLLLLPPSEGKTAPRRGRRLDLATLSVPALTPVRERVLDALVRLCRDDPHHAAEVLGLGPTQAEEVRRDATLLEVPTARADRVYTGVLHTALDLDGLDPAARRRASRAVVVASGLFGLLHLADRVPAYRLAGDVSLPGLGPVAAQWRPAYAEVLPALAGRGLVVDLRSQTYVAFGRPAGPLATRTATVRVLQEHAGRRRVVSHLNKHTKGRLAHALLAVGAAPRSVGALADVWRDLGWTVEVDPADPTRLDVVVTEV